MIRRNPSPGVRLVADALIKSDRQKQRDALIAAIDDWGAKKKRPKCGRPTKSHGQDYDTLRAKVIYNAACSYPGHQNVREWIALARTVAVERGGEAARLFPRAQEQNLESSVSRGMRKLGIPRYWNRLKLAKK